MTTGILALTILGVILAQVGLVVLIGFVRQRHQYLELEKRQNRIQSIDDINDFSRRLDTHPNQVDSTWQGFKAFKVKRRVYEDKNHSICSFYLAPMDQLALPPFKPGQFLTFKLSMEDAGTGESKSLIRCYSLSDRPYADHYRISVKRVPAPDDQQDAPPGQASNFLHDQVQEGDQLMVKAPSGHFHLVEEPQLPLVLIAGGIGITPMLSMLNALLEKGVEREVWLFYGVRNSSELIMRAHLKKLTEVYQHFHLHLCYSRPDEQDVMGIDYQHAGRVDVPLLQETLKLGRYQFYVCGPKAMMESIVPGLETLGVDAGDIHYETFGPASLIKNEKSRTGSTDAQVKAMNVSFTESGKRVDWDPKASSLLAFAETQGIEVESGCRAGSCGSCQTVIESGEVEYSQEPDADIEPDHCLLCIAMPKGDLKLAL
ncbi:MAG: 2Fe-2S iron-sulfur cluster binding domain-containing protein [Candidatus Thiodiazotropha sp. (ex Monitilora ramsayi)]|nr:2Fe-2S iron-sulfur cluster binding domain-containing protein [Candidatus Thiodiazotropha sp. (ex Monitilora ramsayi)]